MELKPLKYWFWWPIRTYDPFEADTPPVMQAARNIYATLVSDFIDGKPQGLIAKEWQVSENGKIWRFFLRKDLKFEDGTPITGEIVLLNFKRMLWLTRNEGLVLNSLLPEVTHWKSMHEPSKVVRLENSNELVFEFVRRPISLFEAISQPIYGVAHPKFFDDSGRWKDPLKTLSSGQYAISDRGPNFVRLKSRDVYSSVDHAPKQVEIMWPLTASDSVVKAIEESRADLTVEHSFALGRETLSKLEKSGVKYVMEPPVRMHFVHLNHKRGAFKDQAIRQDFRDLFLRRLSSSTDFLSSGITVDASFIPKGGVGYKKFDLQEYKAKTRHEKSSVDVLIYPFSADPKIQSSIESCLLSSLKDLGLTPNIVRYTERSEAFNRMKNGEFDVIVRGTGVLVNNPYGDLRMMFLSAVGANIPDPSGKVPGLIAQAEDESDAAKRAAYVASINEGMFRDAAIITFAHSGLLYLHRGNVNFTRYNLFADPIEFRAVGWMP